MKTPKIEFLCDPRYEGVYPEPKPARAFIPAWMKSMPQIAASDSKEFPVGTVKKCVPVLDAMTSGYIIPFPSSMRVSVDELGNVNFNWTDDNFKLIEEHSVGQAPGMPGSGPIFKFMNPWVVKLPKGYSAIFTHPFNRGEELFKLFDGIVDCDEYGNQVNFPFRLAPGVHDTIIQSGEPMVQVIPFRREEWRSVVRSLSDKELNESRRILMRIRSIGADGYRKFFWNKKKYL